MSGVIFVFGGREGRTKLGFIPGFCKPTPHHRTVTIYHSIPGPLQTVMQYLWAHLLLVGGISPLLLLVGQTDSHSHWDE